jgi:KDO2-lipid IV(A) lauroyltransferase
MFFLLRLLSLCPLWLLHALGWAGGWAVWALDATYRQRFAANAAQAGYGWAQVRGAVGAAGQLAAELPRLWLGKPVSVEFLGTEYIDTAHTAGKGLIFLTPHLGCFEITPQAYAARYAAAGRSITVLYRPPRQAWLAPLFARARQRPGMAGAPASLGGIKQMIKALKSGQAVGLLPDQVPPEGMGVWAPFFGRDAYTMTLAAKLAAQTGATLLLAVGERLSCGRGYRVWVEPAPADLPAEPQAAAARINQWMAALISRYPSQYLWGYGRYKVPKEAPKEML